MQRWRSTVTISFVMFLAVMPSSACTRQSVPLIPAGDEVVPPTEVPPAATLLGSFEQAESFSVAWIAEDETLKVHNPAGIAGTVIGELAYDRSGILLTGRSTSLGSSRWVEIETPDGLLGWVNERNLTETVRREAFCTDDRIPGVLVQVIRAIEARDGQMLSEYVNPERGLIVRHDWWNPEVLFTYEEIPRLFQDQADRDWGVISGGNFRVKGSFDELIRPLILEIAETGEPVCDELPAGITTRPAVWPGEYISLHYRAFHRPAPENGNPFNWRTWAFAFEYIGGRPYLTVLVQYHGDI
ncbi:MAG: hypothetical protein P1P76_07650 [Anaerolineales bacterium]|nr:hypothetical protein [Anaerolineales bacterium]